MTYAKFVLPALVLASSFAFADGPRPIPVYLFGERAGSAVAVAENEGADEARDHLSARESDASIVGFQEPPCESAFYDRAEDFDFGGPYDGPDF